VLLLSKVIERGLLCKENLNHDNILSIAAKETMKELNLISEELLKKAGVIEMNEKINMF